MQVCATAGQGGVVRDVLERLGRPALHVANMPVDVEQRVAVIEQRWHSTQPAALPC